MTKRIHGLLVVATLVVLVGGVSAANAAQFALTGHARDHRATASIPVAETLLGVGPGLQFSGTAGQTGVAVPNGGPATVTFPPGVISRDPSQYGGFLIPVPQVIQITTLFKHWGPTTTTTLMAGRAGPSDFAFCPGAAANPTCTTVAAGGSQGSVNGIMVYTAGPNKFGGTFKMLLSGIGRLTYRGDALPPTVMTAMGATKTALPFSGRNVFVAVNGFVPAGLPYASKMTPVVPSSPATHPYGYMSTPKGLLYRGPIVGSGVSYQTEQTGFPLTTGVVYGYVQFGAQQGVGMSFRVTNTGYDKRTPAGAGRLSLVGGSLSRLYPADGSNPPEGSAPNRMLYTFTFTPQPGLPVDSPAMLMTLGALLSLAAGFAVMRGRFPVARL